MKTKVDYELVEGNDIGLDLKVYALSTCAFCKRALAYLKEKNLQFQFVYVDNLNPEDKRNLKDELKKKYKNVPVFPVLTIDEKEHISGFRPEEWEKKLFG
ncbi:MAG: glutaredoxin family protein [Spirochaetia bacterium]